MFPVYLYVIDNTEKFTIVLKNNKHLICTSTECNTNVVKIKTLKFASIGIIIEQYFSNKLKVKLEPHTNFGQVYKILIVKRLKRISLFQALRRRSFEAWTPYVRWRL